MRITLAEDVRELMLNKSCTMINNRNPNGTETILDELDIREIIIDMRHIQGTAPVVEITLDEVRVTYPRNVCTLIITSDNTGFLDRKIQEQSDESEHLSESLYFNS